MYRVVDTFERLALLALTLAVLCMAGCAPKLAPPPPDPGLLAGMVPHRGATVEIGDPIPPQQEPEPATPLAVGPFQISRRPLSWRTVLPWLRSQQDTLVGLDLDQLEQEGLDRPARLTCQEARAFCDAHGVRLPTLFELHLALEEDWIDEDRAGLQAELTATPIWLGGLREGAVKYQDREDGLREAQGRLSPLGWCVPVTSSALTQTAGPGDDPSGQRGVYGVGFRVCLPLEAPDEG